MLVSSVEYEIDLDRSSGAIGLDNHTVASTQRAFVSVFAFIDIGRIRRAWDIAVFVVFGWHLVFAWVRFATVHGSPLRL